MRNPPTGFRFSEAVKCIASSESRKIRLDDSRRRTHMEATARLPHSKEPTDSNDASASSGFHARTFHDSPLPKRKERNAKREPPDSPE
jgi:hypothetical protein